MRFGQKEKKSCYLYFCFSTLFFSASFQHSLANTTTMAMKRRKKKKNRKIWLNFEVLSFGNEWLTASLLAVEWRRGINVERRSWLIHKVNISQNGKSKEEKKPGMRAKQICQFILQKHIVTEGEWEKKDLAVVSIYNQICLLLLSFINEGDNFVLFFDEGKKIFTNIG